MVHEALKQTSFARILAEISSDAGTLLRQEIQLAKAEVSHAVDRKFHALFFGVIAGLFGIVAALLFSFTLVLVLMSYGIAAHWACMLVAGAAALIAAVAYLNARTLLVNSSFTSRSVEQMKQNISAAKEVLQ